MDIIKYIKNIFKEVEGGNNDTDFTDVYDKIDEITRDKTLPQKPKLDEPQSYERVSYVPPTDEELSKTAESGLSGYKSQGVSGIENEIAALMTKYGSDKSANAAAYERTIKSLGEAYKTAVEEANNDALKRGLARSSIAAASVASLAGDHAEKRAEAERVRIESDNEIDKKLSELEIKRQKALDDFNITYTAKLTEEINRLKSQRDEKNREAIEYNNSLTKQENKDKLEKAELESDLYTEKLAQAVSERKMSDTMSEAEKDAQYQEIYNVLRDRLLTMTPSAAREAVTHNSLFTKYLSTAYYYKLYDEFAR